MNCLTCRGACCASWSIPVRELSPPSADALYWLKLHGKEEYGRIEFECPCRQLAEDGTCAIYPNRPHVCRDYEPGGSHCLKTVRERRTAAEYQMIRDEGDPVSIHG